MTLRFRNGETRVINFLDFWKSNSEKENKLVKPIATDIVAFHQVDLVDGVLTWNNVEIHSVDYDGNEVVYPLDYDPLVIYEFSIACL